MTGRRRLAFAALALPIVVLFAALGVWQVKRLAWKEALIARVDARLAAAPVAAPGPANWAAIDKDAAYTRIAATGHWRAGADTYTQAVTDLGPGYWVMTPFEDQRGFVLLVNRGFVVTDRRGEAPAPPAGDRRITGLLRVTEPHGGFLRSNDPAADRWYSRDVAAIAAHRGLNRDGKGVAPYFLDADAATSPGWPRGGLTIVTFPNNHLQYALTWFAMAILLAGATGWMVLKRPND